MGTPEFTFLTAPSFSPTADRIAFGAVPGGDLPDPRRTAPDSPLMWLQPGSVHAHGVPHDVWLMEADGTGLQQLTDVWEHAPTPAWSPDGRWIAFSGELGLYLVDTDEPQLHRLSEAAGAGGGLTWLPPRDGDTSND